MELARLDSRKTAGPDRKARRYRLVSRLDDQGQRIKRFRLSRADGLPRLERLEPAATRTVDTAR
jgi:hypothetical protein